jgi:hypothetical protein
MDAAVAGLIGAGIGGVTGFASAMAAPVFTARADHKRQRREVYVRALAGLRRLENSLHLTFDPYARGDAALVESVDLYRLGAEVALIGARDVHDAYERTMTIVREWTGLGEAADAPMSAMDEADRAPFLGLLERLSEAIRELESRMRADVE